MGAGGAGAALEAAAIETAVAVDPVVAAEGGSADGSAFRVGRARPAESNVAATQAAADRLTDTLGAVEPATTLRSGGAAASLVTAAVQRTIAGDAIVVAENGPSDLAAFTRLSALPTEADGAATTTRGAANSVHAEQATTADGVSITPATVVVAAVQETIGVDPVRGADHGPRRLTALTGLRALGTEGQPAGPVIRAESIHAIEAAAAPGAVVSA